jgi:unsaturated rhamnogalacturonyl hydrolase
MRGAVWWTMAALAAAALARTEAQPAPTPGDLDRRLREVAELPGEPALLESAGVSRQDLPLRSLESREPLDSPRRRLVILGGLDGDDRSVAAALQAVRWFKTAAPAALRQSWSVTALPCGNPEGWVQFKPTNNSFGKPNVGYPPPDRFFNDAKNPEARYIWRWLAFQGPDLVLEIAAGNRLVWRAPPAFQALAAPLKALPLVSGDTLSMALSQGAPNGLGIVPSLAVEARADQGGEVLQALLAAAERLPRSPLRQTLVRRMARSPGDVAALLAQKYPQAPAIQYIPAVAWGATLRLARLRNEPALAEKVRRQVEPWSSGRQVAVTLPADAARVSGHTVFADLAEAEPDETARAALRRLALEGAAHLRPEGDGLARLGREWTDDMFMTYALLGRTAKLGEAGDLELLARTALAYVRKLQRPDGFFVHAPAAPHAWGRGNGFASLGLMEALTYLPASHPARAEILAAYRRQMAALKGVQSPQGTWRQVIDRPESYREVTATAMNLAAMARGLRLGWLDAGYLLTARAAWSGLNARVADDGALADVCDGTGAGPTLRYYYERPAVFGMNDRGGGMALLAAVEMLELGRN